MLIRDEENYQQKKLEILESFYQLVAEDGLESASVAKIAKRIQINPSLIFYYFKNKKEMTYELVDLVFSKCEEGYWPTCQGEDGKKAFLEFLDILFAQEDYESKVDMRVYFACHGLALRDSVVNEKFINQQKHGISKYAEYLQYFQDKQVINISNVNMAAAYLNTLLAGLMNMRDFAQDKDSCEEIAAELKKYYLKYLGFEK